MNAQTHTPGPWTLTADGLIGIGTGQEWVCVVDPANSDVPGKQANANARLIAAAPDLLAALQAIADDDVAGADYFQKLARAAIAKAVEVPQAEYRKVQS